MLNISILNPICMKIVFRLFVLVLLGQAGTFALHAQTVVPVGYVKSSQAHNLMSFSWFNAQWEKGKGVSQLLIPKKDHVAELKKRILVVEVFDHSVDKYQSRNAIIKELFRTHWHWNDSIQFKTGKEIEKLYEKTDDRYAVMEIGWDDYKTRSRQTMEIALVQDYYAYSLYLITKDVLKLSKSEEKIIKRQVLQITYSYPQDEYADIRLAIQQFDFHLSEAERRNADRISYSVPENLEVLKNRTLLLPREYFKSAPDEASVAKHYKHPFKIVSKEEMNEAAKSGKAGYAYVKFIYSLLYKQYGVVAVDAETGTILALTRTDALFKGVDGYKLKEKHVGQLASESTQQSNISTY